MKHLQAMKIDEKLIAVSIELIKFYCLTPNRRWSNSNEAIVIRSIQ